MNDENAARIMGEQRIQFLSYFGKTVSGGCFYIVWIAVCEQDNGFCMFTRCLPENQIKPVFVGNCPVLEFIVSARSSQIIIVVGRKMKRGERTGP